MDPCSPCGRVETGRFHFIYPAIIPHSLRFVNRFLKNFSNESHRGAVTLPPIFAVCSTLIYAVHCRVGLVGLSPLFPETAGLLPAADSGTKLVARGSVHG